MKRVLFVCDPVQSFNLKKDTTYLMMQTAAELGSELFVCEAKDLATVETIAMGRVQSLTLKSDPLNWFELSEAQSQPLGEFDVIIMRTDPPFDMNYIYATYILEMAQQQGARVMNDPKAIRDCNEKMFINQFPQAITRTLVTSNEQQIRTFLAEEKDIILKPLDGMGGASICRLRENDPNISVIIDMLTNQNQVPIMVQRYLPEIVDGDKRILIINGVALNHCLARLPKKGETRANLAAGGHGEVRELTGRDRELVSMIAPTLKEKGLNFAGLDVIGDCVTEINVTSPTCAREILDETGENAAALLFQEIL